jgi:hypothetical protein
MERKRRTQMRGWAHLQQKPQKKIVIPAGRFKTQFSEIRPGHFLRGRIRENRFPTVIRLIIQGVISTFFAGSRAIETRRNTYAKMLIRHTLAYCDTSHPTSQTVHGEATFDWVYQANGSRRF